MYPQGYRGFESLSLRREKKPDRELGPSGPDPADAPPFAAAFAPPSPEQAEALIEAAIARITAALLSASDDMIPDLVAERRALREELRALRERGAGVVRLEAERARRGRGRDG